MRKQTPKQRQQQIAAVIQSSVFGWSIPMQRIGEIYKAGENAAGAPGAPVDEAAIRAAVTATLERVAVRS